MNVARSLLSLCFVVALAAPALDTWGQWSPRSAWTANRARAGIPPLDTHADALKKLPGIVDAYFADNFGFRDRFIQWNNLAKVHWLHESPLPNVMIGKDGWLFYAAHGDGADISDYQGRLPLPVAALAMRKLQLEGRRDQLAAHGIPYIFVIAPNKHTIYPEFLPLHIGPRGAQNRLDAFMAYMRQHSDLTVIDLREPLLEEKPRHLLYRRNDSHWNMLGGFIGYRTIMKEVVKHLPRVVPAKLSEYELSEVPSPGDLALMLAMEQDFPGTEVSMRRKVKSPRRGRAVLVGDSFGTALKVFLDETMDHVVQHQLVEGGFNLERILKEQPEIVIEEHVERHLMGW